MVVVLHCGIRMCWIPVPIEISRALEGKVWSNFILLWISTSIYLKVEAQKSYHPWFHIWFSRDLGISDSKERDIHTSPRSENEHSGEAAPLAPALPKRGELLWLLFLPVTWEDVHTSNLERGELYGQSKNNNQAWYCLVAWCCLSFKIVYHLVALLYSSCNR